ncbi:MAG: helix-turn-helix domain-containing protein [Chloroflexota bacterium]
MERLQSRKGDLFDGDGVGGSVVYAGDFRSEHGTCAWHVERPVPFLANYDVEPLTDLLSALSHPQRLALVQLLLSGPHDRQQLQAALHISSPGQLYHHLNSLLDAGIIIQPRRGVYAVSPKATIPLLVIMAAAIDITDNQSVAVEEVEE